MEPFEPEDFWRAIILYGLNTATYKIALAQCLISYGEGHQTDIPLDVLARDFFVLYRKRLEADRPQLVLPDRLTVMERIVRLERLGKINEDQAIERVAREAFGDVLPRFHTVSDKALPMSFYHFDGRTLHLTDELFDLFGNGPKREHLKDETGSRWDLLEAAFSLRRERWSLTNDIRQFYLEKGYARTDITHTRPVLNGYQHGRCFYCGDVMDNDEVHVDHVIPRQLVQHDELWNLVLAHRFCNLQKNDALPDAVYIEKLIARNEHFIASNHPIKQTLIRELGASPEARRKAVLRVYHDAELVIGVTWQGIRGYRPDTDPLLHKFNQLWKTIPHSSR
ncbi:HNH endonuclease [Sulfobacillus thermosulfidooxidans]|uniref:HNH endonuclease n=1 Tax=Sulfobacillus thermosulfidooxidans TaxID=28034 RepID=UPI00096BB0B9|nr:HNH endonuclease signature motif containing protein [Sulfobacillus thermosulfidooxidans]OLZ09048.1 hypothetical protein BFX05_02275 [Sulfobacillus thermosulfidooxidans]OLZ15198.1 hypothetical protein BFX06_04470 [Sulfobacillus thermosulfidooxidans]OLZ22187.1 hypothetical protein BFX07_09990 [Sulfobacillus thermosulfidooxidans]